MCFMISSLAKCSWGLIFQCNIHVHIDSFFKKCKYNDFRHEEKSVRSHSSSVLHLYILKIFIPLQKWGTIFVCTIFDVYNIWCGQYLKHLRFALFCRQYLKHLRFALFWVLQICLQFCFWYPTFFPIFVIKSEFFSIFFLVPPDFFYDFFSTFFNGFFFAFKKFQVLCL